MSNVPSSEDRAWSSNEGTRSPATISVRLAKRMPSIQRLQTAISQNVMVTPASATSLSSTALSVGVSPGSSAQNSPLLAGRNTTNTLISRTSSFEQLPRSSFTQDYKTGDLVSSNAEPSPAQTSGLVRRVSQSASRGWNSLRRTGSSAGQRRREASTGPVARRRSDSRTSTTTTLASENEEPVPDLPPGLGFHSSHTSADALHYFPELPPRPDHKTEVVAPAISSLLLAGSVLIKVTKHTQHKERLFSISKDGSRMCWYDKFKRYCFFNIDDIKSIRKGVEVGSPWPLNNVQSTDPFRYFTISYAPSQSSKDEKVLHLLAPDPDLCHLWITTLEALSKHREQLMTAISGREQLSVLKEHYDTELARASLPPPGLRSGLDINSIMAVCRKLHIHCPRSMIEEHFLAADISSLRSLSFEQFRIFMQKLRVRADIKLIFANYQSKDNSGMNIDLFFQFLTEEQGVLLTSQNISYYENRFFALAQMSALTACADVKDWCLDLSAFTSFLLSADCGALSGKIGGLVLNRPLNEYFISSSHNTYLLGRQVNGTSSVEAYMAALRQGCRCIEIDCWDGSTGQPIVTHGFTGTTSVLFEDVIRAVERCAFENTPYPLILSLEVHCNAIQQSRMVDIMLQLIGTDKLVLCPIDEETTILPSPEQLKYKILIKVKATNPQPTTSTSQGTMEASSVVVASIREPRLSNNSSTPGLEHLSDLATVPQLSSPDLRPTSPIDGGQESSDPDIANPHKNNTNKDKAKTSKIIPRLAALGVYFQGYSFRDPSHLQFDKYNHIFSLTENTAIELARGKEKAAFEQHNRTYMCRVYPKTARVNSSNFDPNTFWRRGVQMVALNWQTYDIHMQMNQAMFAAGVDTTGYVLKPQYLRRDRPVSGSFGARPRLPKHLISFSVKVISAQQLPMLSSMGKNESISPFIEVQMISAEDQAENIAKGAGGQPSNKTSKLHGIGLPYSRRTRVVHDNGFNPRFDDLIELSLETKYPELVFVRFVVYSVYKNHNRELAVYTAKLNSLETGYRHLPLYNNNGEELIFSTLFCHFTKREPETKMTSMQDVLEIRTKANR